MIISRPGTFSALGAIGLALGAVTPATATGSDAPPPQAISVEASDAATLAAGNTHFALDLYARLSAGNESNLFFSPHSISTALAMTSAGARGETAEQMAQTLHLTLPVEALHAAFGELDDALKSAMDDRAVLLATANRLWGRAGEPFLPAYLELVKRHYGGGFQAVDFGPGREHTRLLINDWVSQQTLGRIDELLQPGDLDPATVLVLTNAIYFKGTWQTPFDPQYTRPHRFHLADGATVETPMMWGMVDCAYHRSDLLEAVELPYDGDRLGMVILLPREVDGLAAVEAALTAAELDRWIAGMKPASMSVALPRFEFESRFDLSRTLAEMGMPLAFSGGADFTGMHGRGGIWIDTVIHQANITVNEEGSEAAAATAVIVTKSGGWTFRADHPFLFLIRDRATGAVLFMGRVTNPSP